MKNKLISVVSSLALLVLLGGCNDSWEEHTRLSKDVKDVTVLQLLEGESRYADFVALLRETGLDKDLNSELLFTVFAPSNEALAAHGGQLDGEEAKRLFVAQHISEDRILLDSFDGERLQMLNRKFVALDAEAHTVDGKALYEQVSVVRNGVVYGLEGVLTPLPNVWNYVSEVADSSKYVDYLNSLTGLYFDPELSEQIGFEEDQIVYDSVFVSRNLFNMEVADLAEEDSVYTLFLIGDAAFDAEFQKFKRYFRAYTDKNLEPDSRDSALIRSEISRNYIFKGAFAPDALPAELFTIDGVRVSVDAAQITSSFAASNGYVYHLESCPVALEDKIPVVTIEAEQLARYFGVATSAGNDDEAAQGYLRSNPMASGGYDYVLDNHITGRKLVNGLILSGGKLPSVRYQVYWRAVNNFRTSMRNPNDNVLRQRLGTVSAIQRDEETGEPISFGPPNTGSISTSFYDVLLTEYSDDPLADETYIGVFNNSTYEEVFFQLVPEGESTRAMAATLDYIRLVPLFN